ncbi:MAG: hypothetical protein QOC70_2110 [Verrucomicrobiota bacterium]
MRVIDWHDMTAILLVGRADGGVAVRERFASVSESPERAEKRPLRNSSVTFSLRPSLAAETILLMSDVKQSSRRKNYVTAFKA